MERSERTKAKPMSLYDVLACPTCKGALLRQDNTLVCPDCQRSYPIINNIPILLPDGSAPVTQYQHELQVRAGYDPWVHRVVLQSLPPDAIILEIGAGNMSFDVPNIIRMDVTLTPYVDVVGDAHALPFLPNTFAFAFSLAVVEHLRQPFVAAQEIYNALRNGGYVYNECNFVFPYHAYPHHYFNMTQQGLDEVHRPFTRLRSGVAPYQMPSFAVQALLETYLQGLGSDGDPDARQFTRLLQQVLDQPLRSYDSRFSEEAATRCAAGVYFFGIKYPQSTSDVIPAVVQSVYNQTPGLQQRFPNIFDLGTANNIMVWAQIEGRQHLDAIVPFRKNETIKEHNQRALRDAPVIEPVFGYIDEPHRRQPALSYGRRYLKRWVGWVKRTLQSLL